MIYKYRVDYTSNFKREYKKIKKQGKNLNKIRTVVEQLACGNTLESQYKDHKLNDNKIFKDCRECHIEPDWLLVYRINNNELILLLVETGSHSDLF